MNHDNFNEVKNEIISLLKMKLNPFVEDGTIERFDIIIGVDLESDLCIDIVKDNYPFVIVLYWDLQKKQFFASKNGIERFNFVKEFLDIINNKYKDLIYDFLYE